MSTHSHQTLRRTKAQWQSPVDQWRQSHQNATQFCNDQNIGYASFCQWRKRLSPPSGVLPKIDFPDFIDLSELKPDSEQSAWHIVLSLGDGIELKLSRG